MTTDKLNYVYNYVMDDIEYSESEAVEYAINTIMKNKKIAIGSPEIQNNSAQNVIAGCIKVIEVDLEYHYYFLYIDKNGCRNGIDINEKMSHYGEIRRDLVVLYILTILGLRNISAYHIHEGYLVRAVRSKNGKIKLKQILSYGIQSLNNEAQHALGNEEAIFDRYKCDCGHSVFYIKDETVGINCPFCNQHIAF